MIDYLKIDVKEYDWFTFGVTALGMISCSIGRVLVLILLKLE